MNGWVEKNTYGMITNILDEIPEAAIMYLVNAVAFDGKWEKPYESYQVHDTDFYPENGSEAEVPMMYSEESRFLKDEHSAGFVKPYVTGYSFVALLPEEGLALEDYLNQLSGEGFLRMMEEEEQMAVSAGCRNSRRTQAWSCRKFCPEWGCLWLLMRNWRIFPGSEAAET